MEKDWFPRYADGTNGQFYARFLHISTDPVMGVKTANNSKICVVLNPTTLRSKGLSVKCSDNSFNKNWPLGHAQYSLGGNLGPLVPAVSDARRNGFDDVLWMLDDFIQEMTVLNVFFLM